MQEQRSREAKKAEVTLDPTQLAQLSMADGDLLCLLARVSFFAGGGQSQTKRKRSRRGEIDSRARTSSFLRLSRGLGLLFWAATTKTCFSFPIFSSAQTFFKLVFLFSVELDHLFYLKYYSLNS
jgi:hypothetical protein